MEDDSPFHFFDLPSELRNMVYDSLMRLKSYRLENGYTDDYGYSEVNIYPTTLYNLRQSAEVTLSEATC